MSGARKIYETRETQDAEMAAAKRVGALLRLTPHKMPRAHVLDFAFCDARDGIRQFAEVKCRPHHHEHHPTYMLSSHKVLRARALVEAFPQTDEPFLAVQYTTGLFMCSLLFDDLPPTWGGRRDRHDPEDMEPVVYIPHSRFWRIA